MTFREQEYIIVAYSHDRFEMNSLIAELKRHDINAKIRHEYRLSEELRYDLYSSEEAELLVHRSQAIRANELLIKLGYKESLQKEDVEFNWIKRIRIETDRTSWINQFSVVTRIGICGLLGLFLLFGIIIYNTGHKSLNELEGSPWSIISIQDKRGGNQVIEQTLNNEPSHKKCYRTFFLRKDEITLGCSFNGLMRKITWKEVDISFIDQELKEYSGKYQVKSHFWNRIILDGELITVILKMKNNS